MKYNFKLYGFIVALSILSLGCEDDDELLGDPNIPSQETASANLTVDLDSFYSQGEAVDYSVALSSSSENPRQVRLVSQEGTSVTNDLLLVPAGSSAADGSIGIPSPGTLSYDQIRTFEFSVTGVREGEIVTGEDGEENFIANGNDLNATTSESVSVQYYDRTPAASETGLNYLLDWENPSTNDLDAFVIDRGFTALFEASETGSRYESDVFDNTNPDGVYDFHVLIFDPANPETTVDIDARIFVTDSEGNKTLLEFVVPSGTATGGFVPVGTFTQTTVDGVATYTNITVL